MIERCVVCGAEQPTSIDEQRAIASVVVSRDNRSLEIASPTGRMLYGDGAIAVDCGAHTDDEVFAAHALLKPFSRRVTIDELAQTVEA